MTPVTHVTHVTHVAPELPAQTNEAAAAGARDAVRFVLFGGIRIVRGDLEIEVTQPKQRRLLALLVANVGEVLSVDAIVDALWAREPAVTAVNQIHRHVGALRRTCEPGLGRRQAGRYIAGAGRGYRITVPPDACDVTQFRRLATRAKELGDAGERAAALHVSLQALAIAASPAGDEGLRDLPEFAAIEDERVGAVLTAARQCRRAADHCAVLPHLRSATERHPFDESLAASLMNALSGTGRGAEAVHLYRTVRRRLTSELGCEPRPELQRALAEALRVDPPAPARRGPDRRTGQRTRRLTPRTPASDGVTDHRRPGHDETTQGALMTHRGIHSDAARGGRLIDPRHLRDSATVAMGVTALSAVLAGVSFASMTTGFGSDHDASEAPRVLPDPSTTAIPNPPFPEGLTDEERRNLTTFDEMDFVVFSKAQWARFAESHAQNIRVHWPDGHYVDGLEQHVADMQAIFEYAPDSYIDSHPIRIAKGNLTCVIGVMNGTFTRPMPDGKGGQIAPTNKRYSFNMATVGVWNKNGTMDEEWLYWDNQTHDAQLGLA